MISSQLHTYVGQYWMSCKSGGTSCSLPGRFSYEGISFWGGEEKKLASGFGLKVMLGGSLYVPGPCI